ncbi:ATPase domain-containing protein [Massilia sp. YIM B02763]|uniref:ATPase domain-containing protein n=1 Tax=Massilia sp. YIM B02763 TaxID=3050130 RepID=UPI0025B6F570|nr:ATPase domain-containing protein [Massilia sp. YIM B02763]MDN4051810.1 ATPase domain-containing protein [Massilia sp. YIM B02763]
MTDKVRLGMLSTGVPGLDILLGGGLTEFSFTLIAGAPGSGKTTLAHQIMFALANPQRRALFFTVLGEPPLKMLRYQQQFPFFDTDKVGPVVRYVNLADDLRAGHFDGVLERIMHEVEDFGPGLVFVDSFRSVVQTARGGNEGLTHLQHFIQELGSRMATWQATTFLIGEYTHADVEANPIITVADGMLALAQASDDNSMLRKIRVLKMRGQAHMTGAHTMRITDDGIRVYPRELPPLADDRLPGTQVDVKPRRIPTGVPGLDKLMLGGVPQGHALLVTGPTGIGKTVLGTRFLEAGAALGEKGVAVFFEKGTARLRNAALARMAQEGSVTVVETRSLSLSVEELLDEMLSAIDRTGATRVVIDSLSEFDLYLAPEARADLRQTVFRTLSALAKRGVTVLVTAGMDDPRPSLRTSPHELAFLADAVVAMRFAEVGGALRKFLMVVKVRGVDHSSELREYSITGSGIEVDERPVPYEGVLTGWPRS